MSHLIGNRVRALRPVLVVWLALVLITLVSALESTQPASIYVLGAIAALTGLKAFLVMFAYMEVSGAPLWLKGVCSAWVIIAIGVATAMMAFPDWSVDLAQRFAA
ncbi:cytochrome C oxidase subunit IV family protein [Alcanivorax sp.]|uniref:cytochrome C oxidase subunit IV family protein n=1 Tax=Alcanivorax sp. TaxID=1872427 RepID=UPI0019ACEBD3|nr:cytochrome C oxidase subunit IV family protein [Alcanivorax sp.]MBD3644461.1 hypothetical protein [Alcanivorax sp.]